MPRLPSLSVSDKLLLAAYDLEKAGRSPFSAEDLVVAAWRKFPDTFGLAGYNDQAGNPIYPDSNRVFAEVMGTKPIRKRGLLRKVGTKMYQLTEAGRDHSALLLSQQEAPSPRKVSLPRDLEIELRKLISSKAAEKYRQSRQHEITFYDACAFWGISPRSSAIEFEGRIANFSAIADRALQAIGNGEGTFDHGGPTVSRAEVESLRILHEFLLDKFAEEIAIIRRRTDERL